MLELFRCLAQSAFIRYDMYFVRVPSRHDMISYYDGILNMLS